MNKVKRTCLCGCEFEYTWTTDPSVDEQILQVLNRCADHQGLSGKELHLQIKAEDFAVRDTRLALAAAFPDHRRVEDGQPVDDVNENFKFEFDANRTLSVKTPLTKTEQATADSLVMNPIDKIADVKAQMITLADVDTM